MSAGRLRDTVRIESDDGKVFDAFTSVSITNTLTEPAEASFEVGNDGSWGELEADVAIGKRYSVFINGQRRLKGRVEMNDIPIDAGSGSTVRFVIRTVMADAVFGSANPNTRFISTSIKNFILYLWKPLGLTEADFIFDPKTARDLMTGRGSDGKRPADIDKIWDQQAKVTPPETIFEASDRHLKRHGLMMWEGPDGRIVIGAPDDSQTPLYSLRMQSGAGGFDNNVLSATRGQDASGVPAFLFVAGAGSWQGWKKAHIRGFAEQQQLLDAGFYRPVLIQDSNVRTNLAAARAAQREMTARVQRLNTLSAKVDGLTFWDGSSRIPFAPDTVVDVVASVGGGTLGSYLIVATTLTVSAKDGQTAELSLLKKGLWKLVP